MRQIPPIAITDAKLTSSTAVEVASALYVAGTTYGLGATVSVAGSLGLLTEYKSLQVGNIGHSPASSPTWWQKKGDTYQVYSAGSTYALNEYVIDPSAHLVYKSVIAGNVGNALTDTTKWQKIGKTNRWAAYDLTTTQATVVPLSYSFVITPGERINSISFKGMRANYLSVSVSSGGTVVYTASEDLNTREVFGYYDHCFKPFTTKPSFIRFDLPPYTDAVITVTLSVTEGDVVLTSFGIGSYVYIGAVQYGATSGSKGYSTVDRNFDATINKMIPRRRVPIKNLTLEVEKDRLNSIDKAIEPYDAQPAIWSGLDDDNDGYFEVLHLVAFYTDYKFNLSNVKQALLNLDLEEI